MWTICRCAGLVTTLHPRHSGVTIHCKGDVEIRFSAPSLIQGYRETSGHQMCGACLLSALWQLFLEWWRTVLFFTTQIPIHKASNRDVPNYLTWPTTCMNSRSLRSVVATSWYLLQPEHHTQSVSCCSIIILFLKNIFWFLLDSCKIYFNHNWAVLMLGGATYDTPT